MNHDYAHCADYIKEKCPEQCFRAKLTEDYMQKLIGTPTSWMYFKGTNECELTKERKE